MNKKIAAIVFAIFVIVVFLCVGVTYCMPENEHTQETIIQETENNNETTMDSVQTDPTEDLSTNTEPPKVPETELEESVENNSPEENNPPKENKPLIETPKPTEPTSPSHIEETIPPQPETTPTEPEKNTESTEATVPNEPEKPVEKPKPQEKDSSYYTLRRNFGFYNGTMSMSNITKIIFTDVKPTSFDEKWQATDKEDGEVIGYRKGTEVYIVGKKIYLNPYSKDMFAGKNRYDEDLWRDLKYIEGLDFVNTSKLKNSSRMFHKNMNLVKLNLNSWDMSNVEDTSFMFAGCLNLEELYIDKWDVGNVTTFAAMFQGTSHQGDMKLRHLDVSKWDTSSAVIMNHVFYGCGQLEYIDVSNWNVKKVKTFSHMFADCFKLKELDLTKWETHSVDDFDAFLNDCRSLTVIDVSGLDTSTCRQYSQMFEACTSLEKIIGLETWDVSNASYYSFSETFHCCYALKELDLTAWNTSKADNFARMFANCRSLTFLDLSNFDISSLETVTEMFAGSTNLIEVIGMEDWNLENVKGTNSMYMNCPLAG